jgi:hypothetical protein
MIMTTARRAKTSKSVSVDGALSVFEYIYRDASNYKAYGQLLLAGGYSAEDMRQIREVCEEDVRFIAEQIGVPALYEQLYEYSDGPTDDDHVFHEFLFLRDAAPEDRSQVPWGSVTDIVKRFRDTAGTWDYTLSPHWDTYFW